MLESWYDPATAIGAAGDKVLPLHMLLRQPGTYTFEFQSERPFAVYAYRYDNEGREWAFLSDSATAHSTPNADLPWTWAITLRKASAGAEDYLLQAADRKSTRLTPVTNAHLVCRLL